MIRWNLPRVLLCLGVLLLLSGVATAQSPKPKDDSLGANPPEGAYYLFHQSLENWVKGDGKTPAPWLVTDTRFTIVPKSGGIQTRMSFGDFLLHIEFNVPLLPNEKGQARGNSGVYLQGIYELQILDSYGLTPQSNDCGAIYKQIVPSVNACKPPLQWQTYDITFKAARRKDGKVVEQARLTVVQNGINIIDDKTMAPTPGGLDQAREGLDGPIMLQDHGNEVQFRNIWIKSIPR